MPASSFVSVILYMDAQGKINGANSFLVIPAAKLDSINTNWAKARPMFQGVSELIWRNRIAIY